MRLQCHGAGIAFALATALLEFPASAGAQMRDATMSEADSAPATHGIRAQAIALVTRVDPGFANRTFTEGYFAQPVIMAHGSMLRGHVSGVATLNLEGLTLDRGQLNPGTYGEGYVDRRHPHAYIHEAIVAASGAFSGIGVSVAAGRGFVPFGTDDPMMRPFAAYPVSHHLSQVLERYVAIAAVRRGPAIVEAAVFNGDEPVSPGSPPDATRFGDSWAVRATLAPRALEVEGSFASVTSPELAAGDGRDQRKWSVGAHLTRPSGALHGALVEWAMTDELVGDLRVNRFTSFLAEASAGGQRLTVSGRFENTTRPEEERLLDPFRVSRTPTDLGIIGITRWRIGTVSVSAPVRAGRVDAAPFVELTYARPAEEVTPSAFVPRDFYGAPAIWSMSLGVRLGIGHAQHRMGRYGAALPTAPAREPASHHVH